MKNGLNQSPDFSPTTVYNTIGDIKAAQAAHNANLVNLNETLKTYIDDHKKEMAEFKKDIYAPETGLSHIVTRIKTQVATHTKLIFLILTALIGLFLANPLK